MLIVLTTHPHACAIFATFLCIRWLSQQRGMTLSSSVLPLRTFAGWGDVNGVMVCPLLTCAMHGLHTWNRFKLVLPKLVYWTPKQILFASTLCKPDCFGLMHRTKWSHFSLCTKAVSNRFEIAWFVFPMGHPDSVWYMRIWHAFSCGRQYNRLMSVPFNCSHIHCSPLHHIGRYICVHVTDCRPDPSFLHPRRVLVPVLPPLLMCLASHQARPLALHLPSGCLAWGVLLWCCLLYTNTIKEKDTPRELINNDLGAEDTTPLPNAACVLLTVKAVCSLLSVRKQTILIRNGLTVEEEASGRRLRSKT